MRIFQRLNIIENLLRPGRANQDAGHNAVPEDPGKGHFRQGLATLSRQLIQSPNLFQTFLCQCIFLQKASVCPNPAVLRNAVKITVCQQPLSQGTEGNDTLMELRGCLLQAILFYRPVKDRVTVLIDDKRTMQLL